MHFGAKEIITTILLMSTFNTNRKFFVLLIFTTFSNFGFCQSGYTNFLKPSDSLNVPRRNFVVATESLVFTVGIIQLNNLSDKQNFKSSFNIIFDNSETLQIDKAAHFFTSYQIGNLSYNLLNWAGVSKKNKLIFGAGIGFAFLSTVEVIDGFSKNHVASFADILANAGGTSLFIFQDLVWKEQRIVPKISLHSDRFLLGNMKYAKSQLENGFNDETFWLSFNLYSFFKSNTIPKWLNLSLGYGVEQVRISNGNPYSQVFLSFDVDLNRIKTKSHFLKTLFSVLNTLKVPAPTIEFSRNNQLKGHLVYF